MEDGWILLSVKEEKLLKSVHQEELVSRYIWVSAKGRFVTSCSETLGELSYYFG